MSLPGIVAAKCGAEVTLSDSSELPHCLEICQQSCQMNNLPQVHVVGLTWGHVSRDLLALPPQDIILASDVFFEPEDFEDILTTVYFLMQKNPKVKLWSTYQCWLVTWSFALQVGHEMCPYSSGVFWCRQRRYSRICPSRKTYCWNAGHLLCKGQSELHLKTVSGQCQYCSETWQANYVTQTTSASWVQWVWRWSDLLALDWWVT